MITIRIWQQNNINSNNKKGTTKMGVAVNVTRLCEPKLAAELQTPYSMQR
jgi:hypothetical protein